MRFPMTKHKMWSLNMKCDWSWPILTNTCDQRREEKLKKVWAAGKVWVVKWRGTKYLLVFLLCTVDIYTKWKFKMKREFLSGKFNVRRRAYEVQHKDYQFRHAPWSRDLVVTPKQTPKRCWGGCVDVSSPFWGAGGPVSSVMNDSIDKFWRHLTVPMLGEWVSDKIIQCNKIGK